MPAFKRYKDPVTISLVLEREFLIAVDQRARALGWPRNRVIVEALALFLRQAVPGEPRRCPCGAHEVSA